MPDVVRPVPCFAGNQVFRIRRGDEFWFLKAGAPREITTEHAVLARVAAEGVPVPGLVTADLDGDIFGRPSLLLRHVGGAPLDGPEPEFAAACASLRTVHGVPVGGYGSIDAEDGTFRGAESSWPDALRVRVDGLTAVADSGLVDRALAYDAHDRLVSETESLDSRSPRLLHGDFHPRHVYAWDGKVTGIIDWGDATSGDPVYDLGRIFHSALSSGIDHADALLAAAVAGYGDPELTVADLRRRAVVYGAVFVAWSMLGELEAGAPWPPWWPWQAEVLSMLLGELG